jgi:hypothetical protein
LGLLGIRKVKTQLADFNSGLPALIDKTMPAPNQWWHHLALPDDVWNEHHAITKRNSADGITELLRSLLSPFAAILARAKLIKVGYEQEWEGSFPTYWLDSRGTQESPATLRQLYP